MIAEIYYDRGTIVVKGDVHVPYAKFDHRSGTYRALAFRYRDIIEYLESNGINFIDNALDPIPTPYFDAEISLRDYQEKALERWLLDKKGCIILPTGSGKTNVAIAAINELSVPSLIVVPTLALVEQWKNKLRIFGEENVGEFSGKEKELKPLTVATYDSAYLNAEKLGNRFMLLVFDEVHHLPAESYVQIAQMSASPFRLGLTATFEREDGRHEILKEVVGGKVFELLPDHLAGRYLASYTIKRIFVPLTDDEREEYEKRERIFRGYLRARGIKLRSSEDFNKIVMASGYDEEAYEALRAWDEARKIAYNSKNKIRKLREILERHRKDKIIIFTRHNELVYLISRIFLIPAITHRTGKDERDEILESFKTGRFRAIVSSQVLDEGIDVPDANVGVIMSGSGSAREYIQRLGRILRPSKGKKEAVLYELISRGTGEVNTARRRKNAAKRAS